MGQDKKDKKKKKKKLQQVSISQCVVLSTALEYSCLGLWVTLSGVFKSLCDSIDSKKRGMSLLYWLFIR